MRKEGDFGSGIPLSGMCVSGACWRNAESHSAQKLGGWGWGDLNPRERVCAPPLPCPSLFIYVTKVGLDFSTAGDYFIKRFSKMGQFRPLFVHFRVFTNQI